ncbi:hypothetical protein [Streptomyces sp. NPDC005485]|uniref:hypothetical protein n=1 Tax=Streptomyces sp. NPDC005485 TaxID=3155591 RepID=UPI0033B5FB88
MTHTFAHVLCGSYWQAIRTPAERRSTGAARRAAGHWAAGVNYSELEADILQLIVAATDESVRTFAQETVTRLVRPELFRDAAEDELTADARAALVAACANILTISAAELHDKLATIYDGILGDDELDTGLLTVIRALAHRHS